MYIEHILVLKVTFSTEKEYMKQADTKNPVSTHNKLCVLHRTFTRKKCCVYAQIPLSTQRVFCVNQCLPHLKQPSSDWLILSCVPIHCSVLTQGIFV